MESTPKPGYPRHPRSRGCCLDCVLWFRPGRFRYLRFFFYLFSFIDLAQALFKNLLLVTLFYFIPAAPTGPSHSPVLRDI